MPHAAIAKNTLYQLLTRGITASVTFLITIFIAGQFGLASYGDFTKVVSYVGVWYLLVDFGINAIYLQHDATLAWFGRLVSMRLLFAAAAFFLSNAIVFVLPFQNAFGIGFSPFVKMGIFLYSYSFFTYSIQLASAAVFQAQLSYQKQLIATIPGSLLTLLLVVFSPFSSPSMFSVILSFIIGGSVTSALSLVLTRVKLHARFNKAFSQKLFSQSVPIGLMLLFNVIYFRIDTLLLAVYKTSSDVGVYGLAYRFFDFLVALPLFLSNSLYPQLLVQGKNSRKIKFLLPYLFGGVIITGIIAVCGWFLSPVITVIKPEFVLAVMPFRILIVSLPVFFATSLLQWFLIAAKKQQFLLKLYFYAALGNILGNILFIPKGSYFAAAVITDISELFVLIVLAIQSYRLVKNSENAIDI